MFKGDVAVSFWIILLVVIGVIGLFLIVGYNRLVRLRQNVRQAFSDIDTQIRARSDLIGNLVNTVKGYASHEKETLEGVLKARAAANGMSPISKGGFEAENVMTEALGRLFAVAEAYPDLKANQNFLDLQRELSDIENKVAASRRFLNSAVAEYNGSIEIFPNVLYASMFGFKPETMFALSEDARREEERAPKVSF